MPVDPSKLEIVWYPDPVLRKKAKEIDAVTDEHRAVAMRMIELMDEAKGVGLAAPQVGLSWRMFVAHVPPTDGRSLSDSPMTATREPTVYINPVLAEPSRDVDTYEEGCLSLPDIHGDVLRPVDITITALDLDGKKFTQRAHGLLARCWQHEMDHLDGVLILDRMSQSSRLKVRARVRELERDADQR